MCGDLRRIFVNSLDGDIDRNDALTRRLDDDRIKIERTEAPGMGKRELAEADQKVGQRFDIASRVPARTSENLRALDAADHRERIVARQRRHLGPDVIEDFDKHPAEAKT